MGSSQLCPLPNDVHVGPWVGNYLWVPSPSKVLMACTGNAPLATLPYLALTSSKNLLCLVQALSSVEYCPGCSGLSNHDGVTMTAALHPFVSVGG